MPSPSGYTEAKSPETKVETPDNSIAEMYDPAVVPPVKKEETPPPPAEAPPETKPATGYGKEETPPPAEAPPETKEPVTDEEKLKKEISDVIKDLPESINKDKVSKFALDNKLTTEQLKAYTDFVKEDHKSVEAANQEFVKAERTKWKTELTTDPEFGGENFDKNVDRVEKVLEKYMPNMKKVLTERGSMLPPYIMKDFLALSKVLNPVTPPLVTGDPGQTESKDKNFLEDMYQ